MAYLLVTLGAVILSVHMAGNRGRDETLAVVGGLLFGLLCPLYYLFVGDSKELRKEKLRMEIEAEKTE